LPITLFNLFTTGLVFQDYKLAKVISFKNWRIFHSYYYYTNLVLKEISEFKGWFWIYTDAEIFDCKATSWSLRRCFKKKPSHSPTSLIWKKGSEEIINFSKPNSFKNVGVFFIKIEGKVLPLQEPSEPW
jgi:hypothetical protein